MVKPAPANESRNKAESASEEFREGGYGWAYGVFLSYYLSSDVFPGTSSLSYTFIGGLSIRFAMLIAPLGTVLSQRISNHLVLNLGAIMKAIALIATSFVKTNWQIFLSQGIAFGFGMEFCFVASVLVPSHWFTQKRSLANGIASGGLRLGGLIYSLATEKMLQELGIAWTARILYILAFTAFFCTLAYVVLLFSLPSYSVTIGITQNQGSLAGALLSLGQVVGRPGVGLLSDRLGRIPVTIIATFLPGILSLFQWIFANSVGLICFFAVLVGLFSGNFLAAMSPITAEVVGLAGLPAVVGIFCLVLCPPLTVAESIAL
ncbi:MFS general substrate transporter [Penicillium malachiteum]|nr:MFS general substrate transporter [Penicillium malachiteum]